MCLGEGVGDLREDGNDATSRHRPEPGDQRLEVDPVEVLHRVVEHAVGGAAVVVDRDGVRVGQLAGELYLPLEAREVALGGVVGRQELHRRGAPEERVLRAIDDAHAALAELRLQRVLTELPLPLRFELALLVGDDAAQIEIATLRRLAHVGPDRCRGDADAEHQRLKSEHLEARAQKHQHDAKEHVGHVRRYREYEWQAREPEVEHRDVQDGEWTDRVEHVHEPERGDGREAGRGVTPNRPST